MCVCVYMYIFTYIHTYNNTYIYIYVYLHMFIKSLTPSPLFHLPAFLPVFLNRWHWHVGPCSARV